MFVFSRRVTENVVNPSTASNPAVGLPPSLATSAVTAHDHIRVGTCKHSHMLLSEVWKETVPMMHSGRETFCLVWHGRSGL